MWQFVEAVVSNHAPPPPNFTSLLFVFTNSDYGNSRSILSYLPEGYTQADVDEESSRIAIDLDNNVL
jgi:hypothetical protein